VSRTSTRETALVPKASAGKKAAKRSNKNMNE